MEKNSGSLKFRRTAKPSWPPFWMMSWYKRHVGKLDNVAKRVDTKLHNVQSVLAKAAAGILVITEKLHTLKTSASLAVAENTKTDPDSLLDQTNQMLAFNGDIIALLGNAQQDLLSRRRFSLQSSFPRELASLCHARIPASNLLFGDDTDRLEKSAREQFRATQHRGGAHSSHRYHPYHRGGASGQRPFLGPGCGHTPSIAFRHLPPNSAKFVYATEGALFISAQLSTDAVSALRKVWVLIIMTAQARI